jgi:hypothetical protein
LVVGPEAGEDRAGDRGRHDEQQERAAGGGELLGDDRQLGEPLPAATVRARQVDAGETELGDGAPQLGRAPIVLGRVQPVLVPEPGRHLGDRVAQHQLFLGFDEVHAAVDQTVRGPGDSASRRRSVAARWCCRGWPTAAIVTV